MKLNTSNVLTIVKLIILLYLGVSVFYPSRTLNAVFGNIVFKGLLLLAIITASMFDIPLAILLTAWLIVLVIQTQDMHAGPKTGAVADVQHKPAAKPQPKTQQQAMNDVSKRNIATAVGVRHQDDAYDYELTTEDDKEILRLAHVSDDSLIRIQTSAIDPHLVGYEEDDVATIDMETIITPRH